jgi:hypothetical protein
VVGIEEGEHAENENRGWHHVLLWQDRTDDQSDRDRSSENAYRVGERACPHEYDRSESTRREPEPLFQKRIRRHQIALVVFRKKRIRNDDASEQVTGGELQKAQIRHVGEAGDADERERAGLRCDD